MADEIRKVVTVDVSGAVDSLEEMRRQVETSGYSFKSLADAKKYIDALRASLIDLEDDSDEYADRVKEIDTVQQKLNKAMKVTGSSLKAAEGSYNALSKKMSELKKKFKETNDEAERQALAKQIVVVNDKLKEMDASIGNYQRNVGNYEAAFTKGLAGITKEIEALGNPLAIAKNGVIALGNAFKALIANPVGAAIMAIVVAIKALKKGFDSSEEASNSLKRAMSALQPVVNAINNVFTGFAKIVGKIAETAIPALVNSLQKAGEWMMKLLNNLGIVSDEKLAAYQRSIEAQKQAIKVTQDLTNREIEMTEKKRKYLVDEAKTEMEVAELRDKAAQKDKYTAKQREAFLEQAVQKERMINNQKLALVQEEYDILKERSKLTDNSKEMNDQLAQAEANLYNARREYYEKERSLLKEKQKAGKELNDAEKKRLEEAEKQRQDDLKQILAIQDRARLALMDGTEAEIDVLTRKYNEEKALLEAYEQDTTKLTEEYELKKQEILDKNGGNKVKEIQERASQALISSSERDINTLKKKYEEEKKLLERYNADTTALTEEYNHNMASIQAKQKEDSINGLKDEYELRKMIIDNTIEGEHQKNIAILQMEEERLNREKEMYKEILALDNLSSEEREKYAEKIKFLEEELKKLRKEASKEKKQQHQDEVDQMWDTVNTYSQVAEKIGDIVSSIADYWQDSIEAKVKAGKMSEEEGKKEFEKTKKMQIAAAIINGLAGVAMAVSTAMSLGPIAGPIMAAVNSALVITTTALQIAKIKSTTMDGGGSLSGDVPVASAPTITATEYTPNYSTNVTGESDTVNLANAVSSGQQSQRVYVVESDIQEAGKRVQVVEAESTF